MPQAPEEPVVLSAYDPAWPLAFEHERQRQRQSDGSWKEAHHHDSVFPTI